MNFKIAIVQMDISFGNPQDNFERMTDYIREAAKNKIDALLLPELWTTGYDLANLQNTGDMNGEKVISIMSSLASTYHINIIAGSIAKVNSNREITNTSYVFNRQGKLVKEYSKVHLFRLMDEEKYLKAGNTHGLFQIEGIQSAINICYDIRFPEWIRKHVLEGAKVIYVPAEWPLPRKEHWRTLLIARAIENQCFIIASNRVGHDPNNEFAGHSMVINPWGEIIAEANRSEQILYGEIDLDSLAKIRNTIPIFEDRRPELY